MTRVRDPETKLTANEELFAQELARGSSRTDAFRKAFPEWKGIPRTMHNQAGRLAATPRIAKRLAEILRTSREIAEREFAMDTRRWLKQAARIAFADIGQLFDADGKMLPPHKLPDDIRAAIVAVKPVNGGYEYKLAPKTVALEQIGRHVGAFLADNRQKGDALITALMEFVAERAKLPTRANVDDAVIVDQHALPPAPVGAMLPRG